jgi:hypothetical protein
LEHTSVHDISSQVSGNNSTIEAHFGLQLCMLSPKDDHNKNNTGRVLTSA